MFTNNYIAITSYLLQPFSATVDREAKRNILSLRNHLSLSSQDILTDFTVEAERIPIEGGSPLWFGHKVIILVPTE